MKKDDWEKPRSKGQHLNEEEIGQIKQAYQTGRPYHEIARELKCSSRVACKYYGLFAAEGISKNIDRPLPTAAPSRFYKSTFEI